MSINATIEARVRAELDALAERVTPRPEPLVRLLSRRRRSRLTRLAATVAAAMATLVAIVGTPLLTAGAPAGEPEPALSSWWSWSEALLNAPPRGGLATQPDFVTEVTAAISAEIRVGINDPALNGPHNEPPTDRQVRVLFADDVSVRRIVLVALVPETDNPDTLHFGTVLVWISGSRGMSPAILARAVSAADRPADTSFGTADLQPFVFQQLAGVAPGVGTNGHIGIAPPSCVIATATPPALSDWQPEPTGSYIVRDETSTRPEWWRVTCHGVIRYESPAPPTSDGVRITPDDVAAALAGAAGHPDPNLAHQEVVGLNTHAYALGSRPVVVWGGRLAASPPDIVAGDTVLVAAPLLKGGWVGTVSTRPDQPEPGVLAVGQASFTVPASAGVADLTAPSTLLTVALGQRPQRQLLVVAPIGAVAVRAVGPGGRQLADAVVADRAAVVTLPDGTSLDTLRVEALDPSSGVIASGAVAVDGINFGAYSNWG